MIIDTTAIKKLICDSGIPTTKLEKGTGVNRVTISNLRSGRADWNKVWLSTLERFQMYINGGNKMNATIKHLVEEKIDRHITTAYNDKVVIKKDSVDVKNGRIRFWDMGEVVGWLDLADLNCTEEEARELIKSVITNALFAISDKPVTDKFDTK